ncbi:hypothetical protein [Azonexus sp.]|uniref:hypothetical protein n=1 Tax=Azonexus sp. TaxID=1872668 RepID=UPI0035B04D97
MRIVLLLLFLALLFAAYRLLRRSRSGFDAALEDYARQRAAEDATQESAPWFGRTGLPDADERELPRYLRREFGELLAAPGALQAADLVYLGQFADGAGSVHFWRIPRRDGETDYYAYIEVDAGGETAAFGWGDRSPEPLPPQ